MTIKIKLSSRAELSPAHQRVGAPDPTLACAREGAAQMAAFQPDLILAIGGGSAMDAGKIM